MFFNPRKLTLAVALLAILSFALPVFAQEGTITQRLEVMSQKLDNIRRSLKSAVSSLKDDKAEKPKKGEKAALNTPLGQLNGLEKDTSSLQTEVNNLRGKVDRAEKYEPKDVDQLETSVSELLSRSDKLLLETASARANPASDVGKPREVKKKHKFLGIIGGGGKDEYDELIGTVTPDRDKELFIVATREVRKNNYDVGRLLFQTIITSYPDSKYLPMAKLAVADSFYLEGATSSLIQATAAYQDWLTFFPTHPLADRVLLKIAESQMRQIGLPDRDASRAKVAEQRLKALLQQYPNSTLKADAEKRLVEVQDNLGLHNLYVANYYYIQSVDQKKGGLKGSQSRYREIIDKYPNFAFLDEALFKLANTYLIEEETDQAARYFQRIVSDYPNSDYVDKAKEQLQLIGAAIPESNPARKDLLPPADKSFFQNFKDELFGVYPMTIDKNGVLMTNHFDKTKFELIDQIVKNEGELNSSDIPKALTTVISQRQPEPKEKKPEQK